MIWNVNRAWHNRNRAYIHENFERRKTIANVAVA